MSSEHLELETGPLAHGGDAVGRDDAGRTVFVRGAAPQERVRARVLEERPTFARAELVEVLEASPDRVDPRCPYAGACGGCQWQHVAYEAQLAAKRDTVAETLRRIGGIETPPVGEPVPSPSAYGYRNRIELTPGPDRPLTLGFHGVGDEHVSVETCDLLPKRQRTVPKALRGALRYLEGGSDLGILRAGVRVSRSGRVAVDVWTTPESFPRGTAGRLLADAVGADTVSRVLVRPQKGPRAVRGVEALVGPARWEERLAGYRFDVSPPSFFQVNTAVAETMVRLVLDSLAPEPGETVIDAYCGVGTFTLPLAGSGAHVLALESSGSAVRDLRRNLEHAGLDADVVPGDAARSLPDVGSADLAVIDPPRAGLDEDAVAALAACGARRVVYVSCDPATFARDTARLAERGYLLGSATPVDLFPQTYHVEVVGVFEPA